MKSARLAPPLILLLAVAASGCNYVVGLGYLIGGPPSIEPDFDRMTSKSMTDKDITVAVACYAPVELKWDNAQVDREVAEYVSYRLAEHKIQVSNPDRVRAWLDANPDWDKPEEIGAALEVKYVIFVDLNKFSLYEQDASHLYRGRAEAVVSVIEMKPDGTGEKVYEKELISVYPLAIPRATGSESFGTFKRKYLARLSEEVGRLFYEYYNGDDIPDAA